MFIKEIELDLPYQENMFFISKIQCEENLNYHEAVKRDYGVNWKEKRRRFQLITRCISSMVERLMTPVKNTDCWKILIECCGETVEDRHTNLLGVFCVQVQLDIDSFFLLDNNEKKRITNCKIMEGINKLQILTGLELSSILETCIQIEKNEYRNEWLWGRVISKQGINAQLKIYHEATYVAISVVFSNKENCIMKEVEIVSNIEPDERVYDEFLCGLEWRSTTEVILKTKVGEKYIASL